MTLAPSLCLPRLTTRSFPPIPARAVREVRVAPATRIPYSQTPATQARARAVREVRAALATRTRGSVALVAQTPAAQVRETRTLAALRPETRTRGVPTPAPLIP